MSLKDNGCRQFGGMQVNGYSTNDCHTKLVVKPASENNYWKVICEPEQKEIRVLTKKIPLGSILHLQVLQMSFVYRCFPFYWDQALLDNHNIRKCYNHGALTLIHILEIFVLLWRTF